MHKAERQRLIKNWVHSKNITTQEALQDCLAKNGVEVTQATLSRDIQEIPLIKKAGVYCDGGISLSGDNAHQILSIKIIPPNLLIVQTTPGSAQSIAVSIDQKKIRGVAGTLAGDDCIFVAIESQKQLSTVKTALVKFLEGEKKR